MFFRNNTSINNSELTLGIKYTAKVCSDFSEIPFGGHDVTEIFIPSYGICFSETDAFFSKKPTADGAKNEILIPNEIVKQIVIAAHLRHELMNLRNLEGTVVQPYLENKLETLRKKLTTDPKFIELINAKQKIASNDGPK